METAYPTWYPKPTEWLSVDGFLPQEFGLQLPSGPIDPSRLTRWIQYCDQSHGICQQQVPFQDRPVAKPAFLVDVVDMCVVRTSGKSQRYVALSYVWGSDNGALVAQKSNIRALLQPGSLSLDRGGDNLPRTISDTIQLCQMLGVGHLWVDRLCIVQDNPDILHPQLAIMSDIYKHAYFTVIAADGDHANCGLPGVGYHERSYKPALNLAFSSLVQFSRVRYSESVASPWHKRAWTFQERSLSPRTLVFHDHTVYWQCSSQSFQEVCSSDDHGEYLEADGEIFRNNRAGRDGTFPAFALTPPELATEHPIPKLDAFWRLVAAFSKRKLSYQEDAERAFSAILREYGRSFDGGFFFGLPTLLFDYCLFWAPAPGTRLKRREEYPSWSWLGWEGEITEKPFNIRPASVWDPLCCSVTLGRAASEFELQWEPLVQLSRTRKGSDKSEFINNSHQQFVHPPAYLKHRLPASRRPRPHASAGITCAGSESPHRGDADDRSPTDIGEGWSMKIGEYFEHPKLERRYRQPFWFDQTEANIKHLDKFGVSPLNSGGKIDSNWERTSTVYFTHDHWPRHTFLHPVPVASPDPDFTAESKQRWLPYLDFCARSFTLTIMGLADGRIPAVHLGSGAFPNDVFGFLFPDSDALADLAKGTACQLLVIAKWHKPKQHVDNFEGDDESSSPSSSDDGREKPNYKLAALWVEWKDSVAYRRGYAVILGPGHYYRTRRGATFADLETEVSSETIGVRLG